MKIIHQLKKENNYSYFLNCPICGSEFKEVKNMRLLEDFRAKRIKLLPNDIEVNNFEFHCSSCSFEIEYMNKKENIIKELNIL